MAVRVVLALLGIIVATPAWAEQAKCLAGKTKCVAKLGTALLKCEQLARTPGKPADPDANACLAKALAKFDGGTNPAAGCFAKLEAKVPNDCVTAGDTAPAAAAVDDGLGDFVTAIDAPPAIDQSRCAAGKLKCVAKLYASLLKCEQLAQTPGKPADPNAGGCITKALAKFDGGDDPAAGCFEKLEAKTPNDCLTVDDTAAVEAAATTAVDAVVGVLTDAGAPPTAVDFTSTAAAGVCGTTFRDAGGTVPLKQLRCGATTFGGNGAQFKDAAQPAGGTNRFILSNCVGTSCDVGPSLAGTTPPGIGCSDVGCLLGAPIPIANAGLSMCFMNTFASAPSGTLDLATGEATWALSLRTALVVTARPAQPCPLCRVSGGGPACAGSPGAPCTGVCDGSARVGLPCVSRNPDGLSADCPLPVVPSGSLRCFGGGSDGSSCTTGAACPGGVCAQHFDVPTTPDPLTTGSASVSSATGLFCPGQSGSQVGAFRSDICRSGANSGKPCLADALGEDAASCGAGVTCRAGTSVNYCVAGTGDGLGCSTNADCGGGVCTRAGAEVRRIDTSGAPAGPLAIGVPAPIALSSRYCVPATGAAILDFSANIPGPGWTSLLGTVTLVP